MTGTIERAFQLAEQYLTVEEIRARLKREGHVSVDAHLAGRTIRTELKQIIERDDV